jgi:hypothetical protein
MKIYRFAVISFFMVFGLLVLVGSSSVEAAQYLGEYCWQDSGGGIARLAITHMGNGHYLVNGRHTDPSGYVDAVNGNAEVVGSQVIMHITSSGFDVNEVRGFMATIVLDHSSLNGTMEGVNVLYQKPAGPGVISYDGPQTLTFITCP